MEFGIVGLCRGIQGYWKQTWKPTLKLHFSTEDDSRTVVQACGCFLGSRVKTRVLEAGTTVRVSRSVFRSISLIPDIHLFVAGRAGAGADASTGCTTGSRRFAFGHGESQHGFERMLNMCICASTICCSCASWPLPFSHTLSWNPTRTSHSIAL